jgi:hypothetical protein
VPVGTHVLGFPVFTRLAPAVPFTGKSATVFNRLFAPRLLDVVRLTEQLALHQLGVELLFAHRPQLADVETFQGRVSMIQFQVCGAAALHARAA